MNALGAWAAKVAAAAERIEGGLAIAVVREQARDFLAIERAVTPKRTGRLADSERIDSISGGGSHARAVVSPHTIYAKFREDGGTISAKYGEVWKTPKNSKTGRARMYRHTLHWEGGGFPMHVTQAGSHYVERAQGAAAAPLAGAAEQVLATFLDF